MAVEVAHPSGAHGKIPNRFKRAAKRAAHTTILTFLQQPHPQSPSSPLASCQTQPGQTRLDEHHSSQTTTSEGSSPSVWICCTKPFPTYEAINRHIDGEHARVFEEVYELFLAAQLAAGKRDGVKASPSLAKSDSTLSSPSKQYDFAAGLKDLAVGGSTNVNALPDLVRRRLATLGGAVDEDGTDQEHDVMGDTGTKSQFRSRRVQKGRSDPVRLTCDCNGSGQVLLFYRYTEVPVPDSLAQHQHELCTRLNMTGKIRISSEGMNVTVAGNPESVAEYMDETSSLDVLMDLGLSRASLMNGERDGEGEQRREGENGIHCVKFSKKDWERKRKDFFKPSPGCRHVFENLSVKLVDEICPFGVKDITPETARAASSPLSSLQPSTPQPSNTTSTDPVPS
ncbi:hypothetical protein HK102_006723, partial [Quaeritorhiza haematococci]